MLNITSLALTLPILILVTAAAVDIIRFPIVKQTMHSTLNAGYDMLILDKQENSASKDLAAGLNWCAFSNSRNTHFNCPPCTTFQKGKTCTGAADFDAAKVAVTNAGQFIFAELTKTNAGMFSQLPEDVTVKVSLYNLITSRNSARGRVAGKELVASYDSSSEAKNLGLKVDLEKFIDNTYVKPGNRYLGISLGKRPGARQRTADIPIIALTAAVRVKHIFQVTRQLQPMGSNIQDNSFKTNETIIKATIVRPLTRAIRLSGKRS